VHDHGDELLVVVGRQVVQPLVDALEVAAKKMRKID
jgi:hypothetical protein